MKTGAFFLVTILFLSCGWNENMAKMDVARGHADSVIDLLNSPKLFALLPDSLQKEKGYQTLQETLAESCDWENRRGKFIDYYTLNQNGQRSMYFIYEYFLNCDSLRLTLYYNLEPTEPVLQSMNIQPLEQPCGILVDPMKSILKDPDWEKRK